MKTHIFNNQQDLAFNIKAVQNIAKAVVAFEGKSFDEVSIHFVTTKEICKLHMEFFNDPSPTDCISFPLDDENETGYRILGEIFVCPQTAVEYAKQHDENPNEETILYIVHGLLHLMGYDDIEEEDEREMREAEQRHLAHLKKLKLFSAFSNCLF